MMHTMINVVPFNELHTRLGLSKSLTLPESSLAKPLTAWKMEEDDAPILRYLFRNGGIHRHLEFGTWQGIGVLYCLEETDATVWTINLLEGEEQITGEWAYGEQFEDSSNLPVCSNKMEFHDDKSGTTVWHQTDALGFIGRYYRGKGFGSRVCQIYCDSRNWDTSHYPEGFFDSALIDGGHTEEIVASDTRKAMRLVRPGGLVLWHDFCPDPDVHARCASPRGVHRAISTSWPWLEHELQDAFWIKPSWLLVGIKRSGPDKRVGSARDLDASEGGS